ncbi:transmembrane pair domain-containing protein [Enterobacter cloacae]|uniref:Transmembrane pair domain-containing protein n=1 Tax=Enterobacter cloacae TaxID=550 RepID=A0A377LSZ9_ENTCL|nr:transmembrane pair domain-containing protein [Enterobacter cloacae]
MQHQDALQRKLPERIFHAVCFEGIATAILAPTAAWLMQRSVVEMGGVDHYPRHHGHALEHYL